MLIGHMVPASAWREQREHGGVRDVPAFALLLPADAVNAMLHRERHQAMVGRMKLDLVDPSAETVEGLKLRRIAIRVLAPLQHLFRTRRAAQGRKRLLDPFAAWRRAASRSARSSA